MNMKKKTVFFFFMSSTWHRSYCCGLLRGIDHAAAAHFSFLIATPIILAAALKEVPALARAGLPPGTFRLASRPPSSPES